VSAPDTISDGDQPLKAVDPVVGVRVMVQSYFRSDYIALDEGAISLVESPDMAFVFDYVADDIPGQIHRLNRETGDYWIAIPLDPEDALERCDGCRELFAVTSIFWNGKTYFACRICQRKEETQLYQKARIYNPGEAFQLKPQFPSSPQA
jgi:hypothetical protein